MKRTTTVTVRVPLAPMRTELSRAHLAADEALAAQGLRRVETRQGAHTFASTGWRSGIKANGEWTFRVEVE